MSTAAEKHDKRLRRTEARAGRASSPLHRTATWFDAWRRRVAELPSEMAEEQTDRMISHLRAEMGRLAPPDVD